MTCHSSRRPNLPGSGPSDGACLLDAINRDMYRLYVLTEMALSLSGAGGMPVTAYGLAHGAAALVIGVTA